jgi:3-oxoacyl-[acyl-carrier protein] reductase
MGELTGKKALVTGGSRGIGRGIALALAEAGCDVAVNYLRAREQANEVVEQIAAIGRKAIAVQADVSQEEEVRRLVAEVETYLGQIDILVNNAGINPITPLDQLGLEDWNHVVNANLTSAFLVTQAVIPGMRKRRWGRLIMLSSIAAQTGGVIGPHYAASKAGMLGLAHSYANLLVKEGITANAIAPALIATDMVLSKEQLKPTLLPVGRFGSVEEVSQTAVLLAGNGYITGQTININGGWYMS